MQEELTYPTTPLLVKADELPIDPYEVLRYIGYRKDQVTEEDIKQVNERIKKARPFIAPKACYRRFNVLVKGDGYIELPYGEVLSKDLTRNLTGCDSIFMIACTIGPLYDRNMVKNRRISMAEASYLQAIGAAAVEDVVDILNRELERQVKEEGKTLKSRYSPGFGDYTLENQKGLFQVLAPEKFTGITLMNTLIMAPEKSVTAIIGIKN